MKKTTETKNPRRGERPIDRALRWASKDFQWNKSDFAKQMGVVPANVTNWIRRGMPTDQHERAATVLRRSVDELIGKVPEGGERSARRADVRLLRVPVVGTAHLNQDGYWKAKEPAESGSGFIEMPSRDPNAYAVKVIGDSMHPRIKSGEYVLAEPDHPYEPGDEVLVTLKDGRQLVREFLFRRDGHIALQAVNEGNARLTLPEDDVSSVHYVAAIAKSALYSAD